MDHLNAAAHRDSLTTSRSRRRPSAGKFNYAALEDRALLAAMVSGELLVQFDPAVESLSRSTAVHQVSGHIVESIHTQAMMHSGQGVMERIQLLPGTNVFDVARQLTAMPGVQFAEPNWIYTKMDVSNDTNYLSGQLWGMYSSDSPTAAGPSGTTNQYGSQAEQAWNNGFTGSNDVYIGIIDEGYQFSHPDLVDNHWTNPFDPVDGVDNDGNGKVDDSEGWDFYYGDRTVYDGTADDHGTHVAGTIGAKGGNGIGVAGVNWNVTMISTKFLGPQGGSTSGAIQALDYLTDLKTRHGLNIVATNNSWGGGGFSQGLLDAITRAANQDILFIAAAGNSNSNNDSAASYPSNYNTTSGAGYDSVIAVASITSSGARSSFSSYGATTVDLGAPGSSIYSTLPTNGYGSYSGTSMATPHVTGAAALYASANPTASAADIRAALLNNTTATNSLNGITVTGGRLDINKLMGPGGTPTPSLSINDVSITEGDSGTKQATFTVSLSAASANNVSVDFATANGSANDGSDYVVNTGTVTFSPGQTSKSVSVTINGDTTVETDETFFVNLSNATNATLGDSSGTGTILNDDTAVLPTVSINDVSALENSGTFTFTVSLSTASADTTSVNYATANGTATSGGNRRDYNATSGTLTFSPGQTSKTVSVSIVNDIRVESDETFYVNLSGASGLTIGDGSGLGTILNDDARTRNRGNGNNSEGSLGLALFNLGGDSQTGKLPATSSLIDVRASLEPTGDSLALISPPAAILARDLAFSAMDRTPRSIPESVAVNELNDLLIEL